MRHERVTWRLELRSGWGERLDPTWLPSNGTEGWARVFQVEDLAGQVCAAGGAGMRWAQMAQTAAHLSSVLEQYRLQWRIAEQVAGGCPVDADAHLAAMAVPAGMLPPRRMRPDGRWRLCAIDGDRSVVLGEHGSADLAEGAAVAARTGAADRAYWAEPVEAEPVGARPEPADGTGGRWAPRVDTGLRLVAFAAEESVATLCSAAATGHTGPDVLSKRLLCRLGLATHQMIKEYRTILRAAWVDLEACPRAEDHEADAEAAVGAVPEPSTDGPAGRWRHAVLIDGATRAVSEHDGRAAASASVAAYRGVDERGVRWAEPVAARPL